MHVSGFVLEARSGDAGGGGETAAPVIVPRGAAGEPPPPSAPPEGTRLVDNQAEEYIANDPLLCAVLRHACASTEVQACMAARAISFSVEFAFDWQLQVTPRRGPIPSQAVAWSAIMDGVDSTIVTGTYGAIADARHGTGNASAIQDLVHDRYVGACTDAGVDPIAPNGDPRLGPAVRLELARSVLSTVPGNRRGAFETHISPTLFAGVPDATRRRH